MKIISLFLFALIFVTGGFAGFKVSAKDFRPPKFGDSKPVPFKGGSPRAYRVHGVDVSRYQGNLNWRTLKNRGIYFAFIKATEGGDHADIMFKKYWREAKQVGIPRAAYHFYYPCTSAKRQAAWFIKNVPRDSTALPPVLDAEWNKASKTCKNPPSAKRMRVKLQTFLNIIERHYGKRPIIYTTPDFYDDVIKGGFHKYTMWLRSVAAHPRSRYPQRKWVFWQYTGTGRIKGVDGNIDLNVYNGSMGSFQRWVRQVTSLK